LVRILEEIAAWEARCPRTARGVHGVHGNRPVEIVACWKGTRGEAIPGGMHAKQVIANQEDMQLKAIASMVCPRTDEPET
jgi:hypothetical protein